MRAPKAALYARAESYLDAAGFQFTSPAKADYLIQILIQSGVSSGPAAPSRWMPASGPKVRAYDIGKKQPEMLYHYSLESDKSGEAYSRIDFFVYAGAKRETLGAASRRDMRVMLEKAIWTASTIVAATEFRQNEGRFFTTIFSHFGDNSDGSIAISKKAKSPDPTAVTPVADAPVAPPSGAAGR